MFSVLSVVCYLGLLQGVSSVVGGPVWVFLVGFLQGRAWWFLSVGQAGAYLGLGRLGSCLGR